MIVVGKSQVHVESSTYVTLMKVSEQMTLVQEGYSASLTTRITHHSRAPNSLQLPHLDSMTALQLL